MMADEDLYRQIILAPGYDTKTNVFGLVNSTDNGQTFKVYWTPYGRVWYPEDATSFMPVLWPEIEKKLKDGGFSGGPTGGDATVTWDDITDRPDLVTQDELKNITLTPGPPGPPGKDGRDGQNGQPGKDGQPGKNGKDGVTPHIDEATGNWFLGNRDTGVHAQGPAGRPGRDGKDGKDGHNTSGGSGGDASLSIEAITDLIKDHLTAKVDTATGELSVNVDDVTDGSIADAVATKIAQSLTWKLSSDGDLIAQTGGA